MAAWVWGGEPPERANANTKQRRKAKSSNEPIDFSQRLFEEQPALAIYGSSPLAQCLPTMDWLPESTLETKQAAMEVAIACRRRANSLSETLDIATLSEVLYIQDLRQPVQPTSSSACQPQQLLDLCLKLFAFAR